ncbi:hypothetical protein [Streptomyces sp. NPDC089799]
MNARVIRRAVLGAVLLAAITAFALYGTHAFTLLGRLGLHAL